MRHFLCVNDCTTEELHDLLALSAELKGKDKNNTQERILEGKILAMVFEKASLRTRMSFQVAMADLGGIGIYLKPEDIGILGDREPIKDIPLLVPAPLVALRALISPWEGSRIAT